MTEYALRLENGTDTAARLRKGDALALQHNGPTQTRSGLRPDGGGVVTVVAGTMGVEVSAFRAWVDGGTSDTQGGYPFINDDTKALTLSDGHATLSRTDTIAVVVNDDPFDGSGTTSAVLTVVEGTPGAGAPTLPATALPLRDVTVPAGLSAGTGGLASGNLSTDRRKWTVAAGGIVPVSGATERDAMGAIAGQAVYRLDTGELQFYDGSSWTSVKADDGLLIQRGTSATSGSTAGGSSIDVDVTFPVAFSGTPTVTGTADNQWFNVCTNSKSATSVSFKVRNIGSGSPQTTKVEWIAIGTA